LILAKPSVKVAWEAHPWCAGRRPAQTTTQQEERDEQPAIYSPCGDKQVHEKDWGLDAAAADRHNMITIVL
jgi:hypothetical protein